MPKRRTAKNPALRRRRIIDRLDFVTVSTVGVNSNTASLLLRPITHTPTPLPLYPYDLEEDIQKHFTLMDNFHKNATSLISQNRKNITTFSEFFKNLLNLDAESVIFHTAIGEVTGK